MRKILVIDDNEDLRTVVAVVLTRAGFQVVEASSAYVAEGLLQTEHPDLIICDVRMPGMDGYAFLNTVREDPGVAAIPFILMTGSANRFDYRRGMASGADDYLFKPFSGEELVEAVLSRLERQASVQMDAFNHAMQASDRALNHFVHEAAKPIDGIITAVHTIISKNGKGPKEVVDNARRINESAAELETLTRGIAH